MHQAMFRSAWGCRHPARTAGHPTLNRDLVSCQTDCPVMFINLPGRQYLAALAAEKLPVVIRHVSRTATPFAPARVDFRSHGIPAFPPVIGWTLQTFSTGEDPIAFPVLYK